MTCSRDTFEQLIAEAQTQPFSGWDFSWLRGRWQEDAPSWDYPQRVRDALPGATALLDMGTGGGEFLASLGSLPEVTCATEGWAPNVPVARARLGPLGVQVMAIEEGEALPFEDGAFDLIINRHEAYDAGEVWRVLQPGGRFLTQQVGGKDCLRLNELLQDEVDYPYADCGLSADVAALQGAGFEIADQQEEMVKTVFRDVGAVVYYLRAIPWQIEGFTVAGYRDRLLALHQFIEKEGGLVVHSHRFIIEALKL